MFNVEYCIIHGCVSHFSSICLFDVFLSSLLYVKFNVNLMSSVNKQLDQYVKRGNWEFDPNLFAKDDMSINDIRRSNSHT